MIDLFRKNKMSVNSYKFQAIILDKQRRDHTHERITVDNQQIKVVSSVKLLDLHKTANWILIGILQHL